MTWSHDICAALQNSTNIHESLQEKMQFKHTSRMHNSSHWQSLTVERVLKFIVSSKENTTQVKLKLYKNSQFKPKWRIYTWCPLKSPVGGAVLNLGLRAKVATQHTA